LIIFLRLMDFRENCEIHRDMNRGRILPEVGQGMIDYSPLNPRPIDISLLVVLELVM
jgi:hypothetical protein